MASTRAAFAYASALLGVIIAVAGPALADSADIKKQVIEQNYAPYLESFNKHDVASLLTLYGTGAIVINPAGPHTDMAKFLDGTFKAGITRLENTLDEVWSLKADTALGIGTFRATGKSPSGDPIDVAGYWTATYVLEGGKWKIRMSSIIPRPPPAAK